MGMPDTLMPVYWTADMARRLPEAGVPLYWVVDGDERSVEIWTPADDFPLLERERLVWQPGAAPEPFELSLPELFQAL